MIDALDPIGLALWYFLRPRPGALAPLPRAQVDGVCFHGRRLATDDGVVRYLEVVVQLEDRKAVEVLRVTAFQHRVLRTARSIGSTSASSWLSRASRRWAA